MAFDGDIKATHATEETIGEVLVILSAMCQAMANILNSPLKQMHHAGIMFFVGVLGVIISSTWILIEAFMTSEMRIATYTG